MDWNCMRKQCHAFDLDKKRPSVSKTDGLINLITMAYKLDMEAMENGTGDHARSRI